MTLNEAIETLRREDAAAYQGLSGRSEEETLSFLASRFGPISAEPTAAEIQAAAQAEAEAALKAEAEASAITESQDSNA